MVRIGPSVTLEPLGVSVEARPGETVLEALLRNRLRVFHGCTRGGCGACRLRLVDGAVTFGRYSKGALDDDERARGLFLSCICVPDGDVVISLLEPQESRFPQWKRKR
jgi:CDP-4-dehydro-6-deoxyglucose reductase, E3